jgi:hypothetical protein
LRRSGGLFAKDLPPLEQDEEYLEVLEVPTVMRWRRIELEAEPVVASDESAPGKIAVKVTFSPAGPPFWRDHFEAKLEESGIQYTGGSRDGRRETQNLSCSDELAASVGELVTEAIEHANQHFEGHELAAARRALDERRNRSR